jgi:hypothetical protein
MVWAPTTEQLLNLDGVRRRADSFRFELCDRELRPIGELHPDRAGATPSISNDVDSSASRQLSGFKLLPDEATDVNTKSDRLRVYMVLQNEVEFRLGTFLWADQNRPRRSWGEEHHSELLDFGYILDQQSTRAFGWGRGATILLIMVFLCNRAGFEHARLDLPFGPEASRGLAEPLSWEPGATWIQMLTDLGAIVGFADPWFDRDGLLHFDQAPDPEVVQPTIPAYEDGTRVIADSIVPSDDFLRAPNDFAVFDSGTGRLRSGRYQIPSSAPHSFAERGFRIGQVENVQGLANQAQATRGARNLARSGDAFEHLVFSSTLDPRHDTHDVVVAFGQRWLETGWSMELRSGGLMQHTMKRVTYDVT